MKKIAIIILIIISLTIGIMLGFRTTSFNKDITSLSEQSNKKPELDIKKDESEISKPVKGEHVVIVSTYGPSVDGSPFYEAYIKKVVDYITNDNNKINRIIIIGGYSLDKNKSQPQAVLEFIQKNYPEIKQLKTEVILEECGIKTWQSIQFVKKLLDKNNIKPGKFTIFAEESRTEKVAFFANASFLPISEQEKEEILKEIEPISKLSEEERLKAFNKIDSYKIGKYVKESDFIKIITEDSNLPQEYDDQQHWTLFEETRGFLDKDYGNSLIKTRLKDWSDKAGFSVAKNLVSKGCGDFREFVE